MNDFLLLLPFLRNDAERLILQRLLFISLGEEKAMHFTWPLSFVIVAWLHLMSDMRIPAVAMYCSCMGSGDFKTGLKAKYNWQTFRRLLFAKQIIIC
jgi:hypothetical protein